MTARQRQSLNRLVNATKYSLQGLKATFKNEQAFRQELYLTVVLAPLAMWLAHTGVELHGLSGWAKDAGSAAVMLSLINVVVIRALVLLT